MSNILINPYVLTVADVGDWWDVSGKTCTAAWQAKGAASYAASLVDLTGNGNDLTEGNGTVSWSSGAGWSFTDSSEQYFDTGLNPDCEATTVIVQFDNITGTSGSAAMCLVSNSRLTLICSWFELGSLWRNGNTSTLTSGADMASGNMAVNASKAYRNGGEENTLSSDSSNWTDNMLIGAHPDVQWYVNGDIIAVAIYDDQLSDSEIADLEDLMAAL